MGEVISCPVLILYCTRLRGIPMLSGKSIVVRKRRRSWSQTWVQGHRDEELFPISGGIGFLRYDGVTVVLVRTRWQYEVFCTDVSVI